MEVAFRILIRRRQIKVFEIMVGGGGGRGKRNPGRWREGEEMSRGYRGGECGTVWLYMCYV